MKCSILTFYFAHNYGAIWQCYALKHFLELESYEVTINPFVPDKLTALYSMNPFTGIKRPKAILRKMQNSLRRIEQNAKFRNFILNEFAVKRYGQHNDYEKSIVNSDVVIVGSDQVWNNEITGDISEYYLNYSERPIKKIAYAASFGKKILNEFQKESVQRFLTDFDAVSLREEDGMEEVKHAIGKRPDLVMDPVFLLPKEQWKKLAQKSSLKIKEKYILFYTLQDDPNLVKIAHKLSVQYSYPVFIIHPTARRTCVAGKQLLNVGPYEFLSLIQNATIVVTNSFHATAFSVIFGVKYYRKNIKGKESRVESLLHRIGIQQEAGTDKILDFSKVDCGILQFVTEHSKEFLRESLKNHNIPD